MSKYDDEYVIVLEGAWTKNQVDNCPYFTCSLPLLNALRVSGALEAGYPARHPFPGTTYGLANIEIVRKAMKWAEENLPTLEVRISHHGMDLWERRTWLSHEEFFSCAFKYSEVMEN